MEVYAHRVGIGLGLVEVVHAGEVPPTGISTDLDHSRSNHDAE